MEHFDVTTKCLHPVKLWNKSSQEFIYVPCNHCKNCLDSRQFKLQQRLDLEAQHSADTLFFTLTYDNDHLPLYYVDKRHYKCVSLSPSLQDFDLVEQLPNNFDYDKFDLFIPRPKNIERDEPHIFACVSKTDLQLFFKRLRSLLLYDKNGLLKDVPKTQRTFRYFVATEYGPNTFRPHAHGLLYFSNKHVSGAVKNEYLRQAWKLCSSKNIDVSSVTASASSYVSKYVTCPTTLPHLLTLKSTRTFSLFSRRPSIGCTGFDANSLKAVLSDRTITYIKAVSSPDNGIDIVSLPLPSQLLRQYCPVPQFRVRFDYQQLLSVLNDYYKFVESKFRSSEFLDYAPCAFTEFSYDFVSRFLPNTINNVKTRYSIGNELCLPDGSVINRTYDDIIRVISDYDYWFGIPKNRSLLVHAILFIHEAHSTPFDYVALYKDLDSLLFSKAIESQVNFYNSDYAQHLCNLDRFLLLFPNFVLNLPPYVMDMDVEHEIALGDYLLNYDLDLTYFYDDYGHLYPQFYDYNFKHYHTNFTDFKRYTNHVIDKRVNSDKVKKLNYELCFND